MTLGAHKNARCEMEGHLKCPDAKTQVKFLFIGLGLGYSKTLEENRGENMLFPAN